MNNWKTGFYYVAKVPRVKVALDFEHKKVFIAAPFYPTEKPIEDFISLKSLLLGINGKYT